MKVENMLPMQSIHTEKAQQTKTSKNFKDQLDEQSKQNILVSNDGSLPQNISATKPNVAQFNNIISEEMAPYLSVEEIQFFDQVFQQGLVNKETNQTPNNNLNIPSKS